MADLIQNITWGVLIERIRLRLYNGWASIADNIEDGEIVLYIQEAIAVVITQMSNQGLSVDGVRSIPEGFITTYKFAASTILKDKDTGYYKLTLPQPPINLPLGYSVISPYFAKSASVSLPLIPIHPYQRSYNKTLPTPNYTIFYFVENNTMYLDLAENSIYETGTLYVPMLSPRSATGKDTDLINMPDDAVSMVFDFVIAKLTQRLQTPTDNVNDGVSKPTQRQS